MPTVIMSVPLMASRRTEISPAVRISGTPPHARVAVGKYAGCALFGAEAESSVRCSQPVPAGGGAEEALTHAILNSGTP